MSAEELLDNLNSARGDYAEAYIDYRKNFGGKKKKKIEEFEKTIEPARKFIEVGDSQKLEISSGNISEDIKKLYQDANTRKQNFIKELTDRGIKTEQAEAIYNTELKKAEYEAVKIEYGNKLYGDKRFELEKAGKSGEELENELKKYKNGEIFQKVIINENDALTKAQVESWPPKEKEIFKKALEKWSKIPKPVRWAASAAIATGLAVSGGYVAGGAAALAFAGYRFGRAALAGFTTIGAERVTALGIKGWEATIGKKKTREYRIEELRKKFVEGAITEKQSAEEYQKILEQTAKRVRKQNMLKWGVAAAAGGSSMLWGGALDHALGFGKPSIPIEGHPKAGDAIPQEGATKPGAPIPETTKPGGPIPETAPKPSVQFETETWEIGGRGPEGEIIKSLESDPELAQHFGWNGVDDLDKWAGIKAHKLWLEHAQEAIKNPDTLKQLKDLGYSENMEGYAQMMRRIGKGTLEIDPTSKKINLVDMDYLKAKGVGHIAEQQVGGGAKIAEQNIGGPKIVEDVIPQQKTGGPAIFEDADASQKPKIGNWEQSRANVTYEDEISNTIPESYYIKPNDAAHLAAENAVKYPEFYSKINKILGDSYFRYQNFKDFKVGMLLDKDNPQWRLLKEAMGEIKSIKPEEYLNIDSGMKKLLSRANGIFENISDPIEKESVRKLTLDMFLKKYSGQLDDGQFWKKTFNGL